VNDILTKVIDELKGAWRYRWAALGVAWAVSVLGWVVVLSLPDRYQATARVYVDTRTALRPLLQGVAVDQDVESQLIMVRQALLGRPNLERVAQEADLLLAAATPEQRQGVVDGMAEHIEISLEPPAVRDPRIPNTFYRISYQHPDRSKAIKVVDTLLNSFVEDTLGTKRGGAESAQRFLRDQLKQYEERLASAESRLAEFKKINVGLLPGDQGGYFQRLQREEAEVQRVEASLRVAMSRRQELDRQLRGETPYVPAMDSPGRGTAAGGSGTVDTASRIRETQARLDELLLKFTDKHPDVVAARETLEQLKARQATELAAVQRGDAGAAAVSGASSNPVYQNIQLALNEADVEIAALRGELQDHRSNVAQLRQALDTAPEVEAEYAKLTRDYDVTHTQYNALLQRLEQARVSEDAQETGIVDFDIVDPPTADFNPVFPNRHLMILGILVGALLLGAGIGWLLHQMRPVFHNSRSLAELTGLPVLGVVSLAFLERQRAELRQDYLRYSGAVALLVVATLAVLMVSDPGARAIQRLIS
jgi:polysaccharide chain length determinant protein (PEP-CTERM system associated)